MRRSWGLLGGLALVTIALFAAYSGVLSVLLPQHIALIDPDNKVASLALVTAVSFGVTAFAQPLFGALSDATRSRWGRRVPWMLGGAVVGGAALGAMGTATSVWLLVVLWAVAQFALNGTDIASSVYVVDAFPSRRRARAAAVLGLAAIIGGVAGAVVAGRFPAASGWGYGALALGVVVVVVGFALAFPRELGQQLTVRERVRVREFLVAFWVSPRRDREFFWLVVWRAVFAIGYGTVHSYLLYLLTDYIGVDESAAAAVVGQLTIVGGAGVAVAVIVGGWWSDRVGRRRPFLVVACALVVGANVVPLVVPSVAALVVVASALGIGLGLAIACGTALASEVLPDPLRSAARGMGLYNFGTNVGQAVAPLVAAAVISSWGGYSGLFVTSAALMLVAAAVLLVVRAPSASRLERR